MDKFSPEVRSRIMASIKQKNTSPEKLVFSALRKQGVYFQKHYRRVIGSPDIAIPKKKIAIFIDGDFWHGYRFPLWKHRLHSEYWVSKIQRNRARDIKTFYTLRRKGWKVLRVWEHEILKDHEKAVDKIIRFLMINK